MLKWQKSLSGVCYWTEITGCQSMQSMVIKNFLAWEYFFTHKSKFGVHYRTGSTGSTGSPGRWIPGSLGRWVRKYDPVPSLMSTRLRRSICPPVELVAYTHVETTVVQCARRAPQIAKVCTEPRTRSRDAGPRLSLTPNSHRRPDTTKQSCPCRVWRVAWRCELDNCY